MAYNNEEDEIANLINIYSCHGKNKFYWELLLSDIRKQSVNSKITCYFTKKIEEQSEIDLTLNIIDYIIDNETNDNIITLFSYNDFVTNVLNLLKINSDNLIHEKILFLIRKWANQLKEKYPIFMEKYNKLLNDGIKFPEENENFITYKIYFENNENNFDNNGDLFNSEMDKYLYGSLEFPDEEFDNQFSNLRTSEIADYFKYLNNSRKNTMEKIKRPSKINDNNVINKDNVDKNNCNNNVTNIVYNINHDEKNENSTKSDNVKLDNNEIIEQNELNEKKNIKINEKNKTSIKINEIQSSSFKNYRSDPLIFQKKWNEKIKELNNWINEGKKCKYFDNLREGIREFLIGLNEIEDVILNCAKIGDDIGRNTVSNIKSDMQQTCYRFECLIKNKKVEKFKSASNGNAKKYTYNVETLFDEPEENEKKLVKEKSGIRKFGHNVKESIFKVGRSIKNKTSNKEKEKKVDNKKNERELENVGPNSQENQK